MQMLLVGGKQNFGRDAQRALWNLSLALRSAGEPDTRHCSVLTLPLNISRSQNSGEEKRMSKDEKSKAQWVN